MMTKENPEIGDWVCERCGREYIKQMEPFCCLVCGYWRISKSDTVGGTDDA
jgi:ribosomal protein L37E